MDIVILHCHFERGGVTQVVENHVRSLARCDDVKRIFLVSGHRDGGLSPLTKGCVTQLQIAGFDYDGEHLADGSAEQRSQEIFDRLQRQLVAAGVHPQTSVLHWHNHSLGKNTAAPLVVNRLALDGWRLLLQIHDFAEDNRPQNYRRLILASSATTPASLDRYLYPVASQIRYATLTGGDRDVLGDLGIPKKQTCCLPNSVTVPGDTQPTGEQSLALIRRVMKLPQDARWCLYPVRGIRRKNVGEFLLLSRWLPENCFAGITLCPTTDVEKRSYQRWQRIAGEVASRSIFDAAHHPQVSFADNLAASDFVLSTSVAEGFGMAFLEPWLAMRGVVARRLPGVTADFESSGVLLPSLYSRIPIPGESSWLQKCHLEIKYALDQAWSAVPKEFRPSQLELPVGADTIDFARLPPVRQEEVLRNAADSPQYESGLQSLSRDLIEKLEHPPGDDLIRQNAQVVGRQYSVEAQGEQLQQIYYDLLQADIDTSIRAPSEAGSAGTLVSQARPFFPCRTEILTDERN